MQKFKDRIRQITVRKYNLDAELIRKLTPGHPRHVELLWKTGILNVSMDVLQT